MTSRWRWDCTKACIGPEPLFVCLKFADDFVKAVERKTRELEEHVGRKRNKRQSCKTEYVCVNERETGGMMRLQGVEMEVLGVNKECRQGQLDGEKCGLKFFIP